MTVYLVAWLAVEWSCPWGMSKAPDIVKTFVCGREAVVQEHVAADEAAARRKLLELGPRPDVAIWSIDDRQQTRLKVIWLPHLKK